MHISRLLACLLAAAPLSAPVMADTATPTPTAEASATPPAEKKICRTALRTGSNMPRRICHSRAEWAAIDAQNGDATERSLNQRGMSGGTAGTN